MALEAVEQAGLLGRAWDAIPGWIIPVWRAPARADPGMRALEPPRIRGLFGFRRDYACFAF